MADFDVLVIGGGTGNNVAAAAADAGLKTALVEPGPLGGTCLNRGCNPSKMLLQAANAVTDVQTAEKFHVDAQIDDVSQRAIVDEMDRSLSDIASDMEQRYRERENLTLFSKRTSFVDDRTVELDDESTSAEKVVVAAGSRPVVPPIDGLSDIDYLTSRDALYRRETPESLVILGGGYIAVELGHYFDAMGSDVTIVEMEETLVHREDADVSELFTSIASKRHEVHTGHRVTGVEETDGTYRVHAETKDGETREIEGSEVLLALGRRPNTDTLDLEATSIEVDERGFLETNEYLETTAANVWAQGDIAGNAMFKHSGDYETRHTIANVVHEEHRAVDLSAMPHTIFTRPQIASLGATEAELTDSETTYTFGRAEYADSAMGRAKKVEDGFVKVLAAPAGEFLGAHAIGPSAATLIHELAVAMRNGLSVEEVVTTIHAHPTLSKVVEAAVRDLGT